MHSLRRTFTLSRLSLPVAVLFHVPAVAQTAIPGALQGAWVREESTYDPNDRMRIRIDGDRAELTHVPKGVSAPFQVGQTLWRRLKDDGSLQVLGSDLNYHNGRLRLEGTDVIRLQLASDAPGSTQTWRRAGPSIDGEWVLVAKPGDPQGGMRVRADGAEGAIRYLPPGAPRSYRVGSVLWRGVTAAGTVDVLGSDGAYSPARITLDGAERLRVESSGTAQLWVRPGTEDAARTELLDAPAGTTPSPDSKLSAPDDLPTVEIPDATPPAPSTVHACTSTSLTPLDQGQAWGWRLSFPDAATMAADTLGVLEYRGEVPARGYLVTDIERSRLPGIDDGVAVVWQRNPQAARVRTAVEQNLTGAQLDAKAIEYRGAGYRAIEVAAWRTPAGTRYAAVFVADGSGVGWRLDHSLTGEAYGELFRQRRDEGFRLVDLEPYDTPEGVRFAAVWQRSCDGENWRQLRNLTSTALDREIREMRAAGFAIVDLESWPTPNGQRYAVIWEKVPDAVAWDVRVDRPLHWFMNDHRRFTDEGYRLLDYEVYETADGLRYAGVWTGHEARLGFAIKPILDDSIRAYRIRHGVKGISVAVIHDGNVVYSRGFGWADSARVRQASGRTVYLMASISKVIGGTLAARLAEQGRIDLTRPTSDYVEGLPAHHTHDVRDLLAKTGCVWHYAEGPKPPEAYYRWQIDALRVDLAIPVISNQNVIGRVVNKFLGKMIEPVLPEILPLWEAKLLSGCSPATQYHYSTHGYTFAGAALEGATGKELTQLIEEEITGRLGLTSMRRLQAYAPGAAVGPRDYHLAQPYAYDTATTTHSLIRYEDSSWKLLGGGLQTDAVDLARFGWATRNGDIVSPATRDTLLWRSLTDNRSVWNDTVAPPRVGLAWLLQRLGAETAAEHGGVEDGARSHLDVFRSQRLVVVVLSNQRESAITGDAHPVSALAHQIARIVIAAGPP